MTIVVLVAPIARDNGVRAAAVRRLHDPAVETTGRALVGAAGFTKLGGAQGREQTGPIDSGPARRRRRAVVRAGELLGPAEAARRVDAIDAAAAQRLPLVDAEGDVPRALRRLYGGVALGDEHRRGPGRGPWPLDRSRLRASPCLACVRPRRVTSDARSGLRLRRGRR